MFWFWTNLWNKSLWKTCFCNLSKTPWAWFETLWDFAFDKILLRSFIFVQSLTPKRIYNSIPKKPDLLLLIQLQAESPDVEILSAVEEKKGHYILQQVFSQSVRRAEVVGAWIGWDVQKMFWLRMIHKEKHLNNTRWGFNACLDATGVAFTKIQWFNDFSRKLAHVILMWLSNCCILGALGMLVPFSLWGRLLC